LPFARRSDQPYHDANRVWMKVEAYRYIHLQLRMATGSTKILMVFGNQFSPSSQGCFPQEQFLARLPIEHGDRRRRASKLQLEDREAVQPANV
jgi:hypothetical protein